MNPADFLTRPFQAVPKPKGTLLDRLRAKQASPNTKVPSIHDPNYKFDFLADVDSVPMDSLPLVGASASEMINPSPSDADSNHSSGHKESHVASGDLPMVPSHRAAIRSVVRHDQQENMSARLLAMQEENEAPRQQIQNYELKQRLAALTADLPKSQAANHVQSCSQDDSSNTTGPNPSSVIALWSSMFTAWALPRNL